MSLDHGRWIVVGVRDRRRLVEGSGAGYRRTSCRSASIWSGSIAIWSAKPLPDPLLWSPGLAAVLLGGLGLILGSFIAALVVRWPEERSVASGGRPAMPADGTLRAVELVPL